MHSLAAFLRRYYPLGLIVLIGLIVRLYVLSISGDFIWDEIFSFIYSQKPWLQSLHYWLLETNPPLHLLLLKLWWYLFPAHEFTARLPSVICSTAAIAALWSTARTISPRSAWAAALLSALTPQLIFHATVARGYALLALLASVSLYLYLPLLTAPTIRGRRLLWLGIVNALLLWTHLTAIILIIAETAFILTRNHDARKAWCLYQLPLVFPTVWILGSFVAKRSTAALFGSAWFLNLSGLSIEEKWSPFRLFLFGPSSTLRSVVLALLFIVGLTVLLVRRYRSHTLPIPIAFLISVVALATSAVVLTQTWNIKFLIIALPAYILLVAYLLESFITSWYLILGIILLVTLPGIQSLSTILPLSNAGPLNAYLYFQYNPSAKQIFIDTNFMNALFWQRYYQAPMPWLVYQAPEVTRNPDDAYVSMNYLLYHHSHNEIDAWYREKSIDQYKKIYLLNNPMYQVGLESILTANGWRLSETLPSLSPFRDQPTPLTVYVRP